MSFFGVLLTATLIFAAILACIGLCHAVSVLSKRFYNWSILRYSNAGEYVYYGAWLAVLFSVCVFVVAAVSGNFTSIGASIILLMISLIFFEAVVDNQPKSEGQS